MKKLAIILSVVGTLCLVPAVWACTAGKTNKDNNSDMEEKRTTVLLQTTMGDIKIALYNETPGHRDNFLLNVKEGAYDSVLFHRVIKDFMIQAGDPASKNAKAGQMLGNSDFRGQIPAEIVYPKLFHKKGVIAAARTADNVNPEKKSSGSQFYIVVGRVYNEQALSDLAKSLQNRQKQALFEQLALSHRDEIIAMRRSCDTLGLNDLQQKLIAQTEDSLKNHLFQFTQEQKEAYTTVGGTPHLDGEYTVYGEVVEGMDVVERIQSVATDRSDRPVEDVRILKATVVE